MKIVGHRGAAGVALENTMESIRSAVATGVSELEVDVRLTNDNHFVLSHDANLRRVSGTSIAVKGASLAELRKIKFPNGESILTLDEVLQEVPKNSLVVEAKAKGWAHELAKTLKGKENKVRGVIAFNHRELLAFHKLSPATSAYPLANFNAFGALSTAMRHRLAGIGIGFWLMNPLVYWLAKRADLEVYVYLVNSLWLARVLKVFYPDLSIATNYPGKLGVLDDTKSL